MKNNKRVGFINFPEDPAKLAKALKDLAAAWRDKTRGN